MDTRTLYPCMYHRVGRDSGRGTSLNTDPPAPAVGSYLRYLLLVYIII